MILFISSFYFLLNCAANESSLNIEQTSFLYVIYISFRDIIYIYVFYLCLYLFVILYISGTSFMDVRFVSRSITRIPYVLPLYLCLIPSDTSLTTNPIMNLPTLFKNITLNTGQSRRKRYLSSIF